MGSDLGKLSYHPWRPGFAFLLALSFLAGILVSTMLFVVLSNTGDSLIHYPSSSSLLRPNGNNNNNNNCNVFLGKYHGHEYRASATIGQPRCLVESKFLKVQQHTLRMGPNTIIDDWLFIDYHDRINVLVEAPATRIRQDDSENKNHGVEEPHFYIFEQTKYALEDRMSWAIVGGIIEPGEAPEHAAKREVSEEMHVTCQDFVALGRYRTDVNRGAGWTSTFWARQCKPGTVKETGGLKEMDEVGVPDTERQDLRIVSLSEIRKAVADGKFLEIQWSATVALALLHLSSESR